MDFTTFTTLVLLFIFVYGLTHRVSNNGSFRVIDIVGALFGVMKAVKNTIVVIVSVVVFIAFSALAHITAESYQLAQEHASWLPLQAAVVETSRSPITIGNPCEDGNGVAGGAAEQHDPPTCRSYLATIAYSVGDTTYQQEISYASHTRLAQNPANLKLTIYYDPENPSRMVRQRETRNTFAFFAVFAALILVVLIACYVSFAPARKSPNSENPTKGETP